MGAVSRGVRKGGERAESRMAALPAVAQLWLSPRLSELQPRVHDADIAIHALDVPPMLDRGEFDRAIYPENMLAELHGAPEVLTENALTPVAAPAVAGQMQNHEDLARAILIHDLAWRNDWTTWLDARGLGHRAPERGPTHSLYSIAVERSIAGDGILIGHTALIRQHLESGALRRVFPELDVPWHPICLIKSASGVLDNRVAAVISALLGQPPKGQASPEPR